MKSATHLVKVSVLVSYPEDYSDVMVVAAVRERFRFLEDCLENVEVKRLDAGGRKK